MARQVWQSVDGKIFVTKEACILHEQQERDRQCVEDLEQLIDTGLDHDGVALFSLDFKQCLKKSRLEVANIWKHRSEFVRLAEILQNLPLSDAKGDDSGSQSGKVSRFVDSPSSPDLADGGTFHLGER